MVSSKLIVNRRKKATILVSKRTLEEAISRANTIVQQLMAENQNDPTINKIEGAVQHMSRILRANPQQMKHDGVTSIEDYMDDAKMPAEAQRLKQEVDMILKMTRKQAPEPQKPEVGYVPDSAVYQASAKEANAGAAFVTDRDEKGEAKAPEKLEVPRLAKKKKKEAEEDEILPATAPSPEAAATPAPEAAAPVAPAPSTPSPAAGGAIDYIPTETLIKVVQDLSKELADAAQGGNKSGIEDAIIEITNVLKSRPALPPEQPEGTAAPAASTAPALSNGPAEAGAPAPVAASAKKADLGDHAMDSKGTVSNGSGASATVGAGGQVKSDPIPAKPEPAKVEHNTGFGGLSLASSEKTADDYRIQDYKVTDEGIRPSGGMPTMDEQESGHHQQYAPGINEEQFGMESSMQKEAVTPPGISEELAHKIKREYPGEPDKAYATMWKIHNEKASALKAIAAEIDKLASAGYGGGWYTSYKPMEVDEDGGRTPEIGEAHSKLEDNTGISKPATTEPIELNKQQGLKTGAKVAAELSTSSAVKKSEALGNELKKMYLEAKVLTNVNDTRPVREAVEAIFKAADMFDEATKTLNKQDQQEKSEAEAAEIKAKNKKSSFEGLALAVAE